MAKKIRTIESDGSDSGPSKSSLRKIIPLAVITIIVVFAIIIAIGGGSNPGNDDDSGDEGYVSYYIKTEDSLFINCEDQDGYEAVSTSSNAIFRVISVAVTNYTDDSLNITISDIDMMSMTESGYYPDIKNYTFREEPGLVEPGDTGYIISAYKIDKYDLVTPIYDFGAPAVKSYQYTKPIPEFDMYYTPQFLAEYNYTYEYTDKMPGVGISAPEGKQYVTFAVTVKSNYDGEFNFNFSKASIDKFSNEEFVSHPDGSTGTLLKGETKTFYGSFLVSGNIPYTITLKMCDDDSNRYKYNSSIPTGQPHL